MNIKSYAQHLFLRITATCFGFLDVAIIKLHTTITRKLMATLK